MLDLTQPLDSWDVSNVVDTEARFMNAVSFNHPLNAWNVRNVVSVVSMSRVFLMVIRPAIKRLELLQVMTMGEMFTCFQQSGICRACFWTVA